MKKVTLKCGDVVHFEHGIVTGVFQMIFDQPVRYLAGSPVFHKRAEEAREVVAGMVDQKWIKWRGGDIPVAIGTMVDVKFRDSHVAHGCKAGTFESDDYYYCAHDWFHSKSYRDIIAYRLIKSAKS